jgi:tRNA pseudouridine55 synthase
VGSKTSPAKSSEASGETLDGVLVIDKPSGPTSSDVVLRVKRLLGAGRVGHTGTLDPLASGVLPLCLGRATRLSAFLTDQDKEYRATVRLGTRTDSGDAEGKVVAQVPVPAFSSELLDSSLAALRGDQMQKPPMFSAVKVGGRKLYELARQGRDVERPSRPIRVSELELEAVAPPDLTLRIACSKGTYVRVLAQDLGERLGCGAHLVGLRRLRSGAFDLSRALKLDEMVTAPREQLRARVRQALITITEALGPTERAVLSGAEATVLLAAGRLPARPLALPAGPPARTVALLDEQGELLALAETDGPSTVRLRRVIPR